MRFALLIALASCFSLLLPAQDYQTIQGKIIDAATGKPLAFAHVGIPERGIGAMSGQDGSFTLKIAERYAGASLAASFMGYSTYEKPLAAVESPLLIKLKPSPINLQEVVVMEESALENIIRRAVRRIPDNYPTQPVSMLGFYRESRTDNQQEYVYLAEGVLDVYKTSYKNSDEGQVGLVQGRKMELAPEEEVSKKANFSSGHLAAHRFDFVKYREDFINEKYFPDYHYWLEGITAYDNRPAYVIAFDQAEGASGRMKGKVFIDTLSYAFIRAEFEIRPEALRRQNAYPLYSGSWKGNRYVVNYRKTGEKWHFSDAFREGTYRDGGLYSNEILITEIKPGRGKQVPYLERLGREQKFLELASSYDPDFWKQYNTAPINEKLERSVQQIKNEEKAATVFDSAFVAQRQLERDSIQRLENPLKPIEAADGAAIDLPRRPGSVTVAPQKKAFRWQLQQTLGLGASMLSTEAASFGLAYLENADGAAILALAGEMPDNSFEPLAHIGLRLLFHPNFYVQYSHQRGLWQNIYREQAIGLGTQLNLSRQRPFFVRASAQYGRLRHASLIGTAENDYGKFKAGSKKFNSNKVNMYYGSQVRNINLGLELALELHPGLELFARGEYRLGLSSQQHLYLKEKQLLFPEKARVPLNNRTLAERDGQAFEGPTAEGLPLLFSLGVVFK